MPLNTDIRKAKIKKFISFLKENKDEIAAQELDEILEVIIEEQKELAPKSDIRELIIEMREGFKAMEKRFEAIDKRFEAIDKRFEAMEKRFEAIDKRFEDINKRFEDMNKRFEDINKRFEDMNKRISFMQWLMVFLTGIIFSTITYFHNTTTNLLIKIIEKQPTQIQK
jgi:chromosome segregation ATPase